MESESNDWNNFYQLGMQSMRSGDYVGAEALWFAALETVDYTGEDDPRLFTTLDYLGEACYCQGKIMQAKNLFWEAVTIKEKYLGRLALALTNNLKRLAAIYYRQNRSADAATLGLRILEIYEAAQGDYQEETAEACLNLAILSHQQEKHSDAKHYYERAVAIRGAGAGLTASNLKQEPAQKLARVCEICERIFVGEICLRCTLSSMTAFSGETGTNLEPVPSLEKPIG